MRLGWMALAAVLAPGAIAQTWEKALAPGLVYRTEVDASLPRIVHALRFSVGSPVVKAAPELGELTVYSDSPYRGREPIGTLVKRAGAIAGINADFFPPSGDPLGLMVRQGELVSLPHPERSAFAWGPSGVAIGKARSTLTLSPQLGDPIRIDGFNQECGISDVNLFSETAGLAFAKAPFVRAVLDLGRGTISPTGEAEGTVRSVASDGALSVPPGTLVLTATGPKMALLQALRPGTRVRLTWRTEGFDWQRYPNAVGGGPLLLRDGRSANDGEGEGFSKAFVEARHPRSAVGRTPEGDVWFVTVDGRQPMSAGASLEELAAIMKGLGCTDAVNLDGGGSTTLHILGVTVNRPSDGKERAVANGVLFFGSAPPADPRELRLALPDTLVDGQSLTLKVFGGDGQPIPNIDVLWGAMGQAWIDQGGLLRTLGPGTADITVSARGQVLTGSIKVLAKDE